MSKLNYLDTRTVCLPEARLGRLILPHQASYRYPQQNRSNEDLLEAGLLRTLTRGAVGQRYAGPTTEDPEVGPATCAPILSEDERAELTLLTTQRKMTLDQFLPHGESDSLLAIAGAEFIARAI
ncbi:hypothetical protein QA633_08815 [Bradyrhizobium barranii]|uniref:hypothetical protein n=1 Tax=Bradyrhizobium barranii TaxID=2992140 RepID=UPI0024B261A9|nr:hypothetical protein [Bradyrhizobium barranii]WFT97106.1 hypothetical protein QA633_08815 [Bradyrhizobium barranii]